MPRIPLTWLGEHVDLPAGTTAEQLAADLVRVGLEEEAIIPAAVTGPLVVGEVLERTPEEQKNGKTINWCRVDVGAHNEADGSPRGIVCGADNFDVGDRVVVALPGAVLPGPFPIAARKTYGHVSDGMICSERELGLGQDHGGIIVLSRLGLDAEPGTDARALLGLGEEVLEINVTPDRGYCFAMRGVAREYALSTGAAFTDPALPTAAASRRAGGGFAVELTDEHPIHDQPGADRFVAQVVRGVHASGPSPAWMQQRLTQAGMRPISLAVDVTNYVMLDLGQPLHAYDLARVAEPIVVRRAVAGETLTTLDDVTRELDPQDLLITDSPATGRGTRILGLAGVMGGADSEVSQATTDLLVEAAHFDPVSIARTARRHKLPSEAAKRFERGVDPQLPRVAVARVVELLVEHGGGVPDAAVTDVDETAPAPLVPFALDLPARLVGVDYSAEQVRETLTAIGCEVTDTAQPGVVEVRVPTWRPDLTSGVDLVEEVARLRGYDEIPSVLPVAPAGRGLSRTQRGRRAVARALAGSGWVETLSYPFVGPAQHDALGLPVDDDRRRAVRLVNPLSDEQPELRTNILVTLLETARRNVGRGSSDLAIFETGLVTRPVDGAALPPQLPGAQRPSTDELAALHAGVPAQPRRVAGVLTGQRDPAGWWGPGRRADHTDALAGARTVADALGVELVARADPAHAPWHPGRCARLETLEGTLVGHAGELHPKVVAALGLPARSAAFEVDLDVLLAAAPTEPLAAREISTFPVAKEDIALVVDQDVPAADVEAAVRAGARASAAGDVLEELALFDVYTGPQIGEGKKSLAYSLRLRAGDRTLTAEESAAVRDGVVAEAGRRVGAVLRA